jgi:hypothetical protein
MKDTETEIRMNYEKVNAYFDGTFANYQVEYMDTDGNQEWVGDSDELSQVKARAKAKAQAEEKSATIHHTMPISYLNGDIWEDVLNLYPLEETDIRKLERTLTKAPEVARAGMLQILPLIGITAYERESKWHILRPNEALIF